MRMLLTTVALVLTAAVGAQEKPTELEKLRQEAQRLERDIDRILDVEAEKQRVEELREELERVKEGIKRVKEPTDLEKLRSSTTSKEFLERIDAASQLADRAQAEDDLLKMAKELERHPDKKALWVGQTLSLTQFAVGDVLIKRANYEQTVNQDHDLAAKLHRRAIRAYDDVAEGADVTGTAEGSSLQAAALWKGIYSRALLYDAHRTLAKLEPQVRAHANRARQYQKAAERKYAILKRDHPTATLEQGRNAVRFVQAEISRRFR